MLETRDLLMNDVQAEIIDQLKKIGGFHAKELYAAWNLEKETGLMIAVLAKEAAPDLQAWSANTDEKLFTAKRVLKTRQH